VERLRAAVWYLLSEWLSTFCPTVLVADALTIQDYYRSRYGKQSVFILMGRRWSMLRTRACSRSWGWRQPVLSLREPDGAENQPLEVREAFRKVDTPMKLA